MSGGTMYIMLLQEIFAMFAFRELIFSIPSCCFPVRLCLFAFPASTALQLVGEMPHEDLYHLLAYDGFQIVPLRL